MIRFKTRFERWWQVLHERSPLSSGALIAAGSLAAIYCLDCIAGHPSGMRLLYLLPIWIATRMSGFGIAFIMVLVITALLTGLESLTGESKINQLIGNMIIRFGSLFLLTYLIWHFEQRLEIAKAQAQRDALTGTHNRGALETIFEKAVNFVRSTNRGLVIAMIDCDDFKSINDKFGHAFGDKVLQNLVQDIRVGIRPNGSIVRTGGDEFLIVLENMELDEGYRLLERIKHKFEITSEEMGCKTSLSYGLARYGMHGFTLKEMMQTADQDLYFRKKNKLDKIAIHA